MKKYVFSELYDSTQTKARQIAEKNKFKLQGRYQSSGGSDIPLNALNVPQGSVVVTAAGRKLIENIDYTVDYTLGRVKILNTGLLESGTPIQISLESNSLFNFQTKTLVGTHLDYRFSDDFNIGATVMNLTERPLTQKVNIGDEPISNTIWGLNGTYTTKSQFLTTLVDKLPFLQTKEPSSITIDGEFAQLIPGHAKTTDKTGAAYIDDFEGSETPIDLRTYSAWSLASTPATFTEAQQSNNLNYGRNRAKIAWYVIDPIFTRVSSATPSNIKNDENTRNSNYVREIYEKEIFKNVDNATGIETNIPVLNVAFYPREKGPYNFDAKNVNPDGSLQLPKERWGGIQRELLTNDFEAANVEFIEFWLMDPFLENQRTNKGGELYFDLGNVSEDVLKDSRKSYEQGLPTSDVVVNVDTTVWGRVPSNQSNIKAFDNSTQARKYQDVGLDGLSTSDETEYYKAYLDTLATHFGTGSAVYQKALEDPSSDDFMYFRSGAYDQASAGILERYKKYNGLEGNSPALVDANTDYTPSSTSNPDDEDINDDYTLNENESFFEYKVDIKPGQLKIGSNFVVDSVTYMPDESKGGNGVEAKWYQFRIPISEFQNSYGSIQDFKSIRFMRMYLKGFEDSVILRFARLELVRGEWRRYNLAFRQGGESITTPEDKDVSFEISSVNIEENSLKSPVNYVLPPGVSRQVDPQNPQLTELNEQSMVLK
ncbi:MAG TPA: cell surface protein SprA, partial [Bacteroidales bacterium]|nr:cell surface protein SprA [Bacteroidales bacterium]